MRLRRRELLAYLVGAGTAGTVLIAPYAFRVVAQGMFVPARAIPLTPVVLLPIAWGVWNLVWARRHPPVSIGVWGAGLGLIAASAINLSFLAMAIWFPAVALLLAFMPLTYWLVWHLVVGPINEVLGVEGDRRG